MSKISFVSCAQDIVAILNYFKLIFENNVTNLNSGCSVLSDNFTSRGIYSNHFLINIRFISPQLQDNLTLGQQEVQDNAQVDIRVNFQGKCFL